jgi:hypothetical protein
MGRPDAAVLVRRAISVQLATVARGQARLIQSTRTGRSAAHTGEAALLPKLTVRPNVSRAGGSTTSMRTYTQALTACPIGRGTGEIHSHSRAHGDTA